MKFCKWLLVYKIQIFLYFLKQKHLNFARIKMSTINQIYKTYKENYIHKKIIMLSLNRYFFYEPKTLKGVIPLMAKFFRI